MKYLTRESPGIVIEEGDWNEGNPTYSHPNNQFGGNAWKLDVGAECNVLLDLASELGMMAEDVLDTSPHVSGKAIRSIVQRVAEFENLEVEQ